MSFKNFSFRKKSADGKRRPNATNDQPGTSSALHPYREDDRESLPGLARPATANSLMHESKTSDTGPLGLQVLYAPDQAHKADIVFIHGLGGGSRRTWSKGHKAELFWPLTFLPHEPDLRLARILSFGYNANFRKAGNVGTAVLDFAKDLLFDLKFAKDLHENDLNIGSVPLLFVVHSMGGLIVKEAYMQGQNDPDYAEIVKAISAITFLATPHRGSNLADILNRVLQSTVVSNPKAYIAELSRNSFTLQKLNEQFRHIAPRLDIVSFYETRPTSVGIKSASVMILEKDSSLLGYPGETSKALDADHHGVCKYDSPQDPNYVTVRNVLKSLVGKIVATSGSNQPTISNQQQLTELKATLAISDLPDVDYIFFRDLWTEGTNEWIHESKPFLEWLNVEASVHSLLWLNGGSAAGKSVLSSYIINHLIGRQLKCQYFFITFGHQRKRTLSYLLRSLAYQIAQILPAFLDKVIELGKEGLDIESADPKTVWNRLFVSTLFKMTSEEPLYWVIDGLDEAQDCRSTIKLLFETVGSAIPLRILLVSRPTPEIAVALERFPREVQKRTLSMEGHSDDLRRHIRQTLNMSGTADLKEDVIERILQRSQRNFLWVRLVVEELSYCHTHEAIEEALNKLPEGMEALYDRMAASITLMPESRNRSLALAILQCVTCSFRPLTVAELSQALAQDATGILDFQQSILKLCGGFVVIDNGDIVSMAHQTAREYLLNNNTRDLSIDPRAAHEQFFRSSMLCLMSTGLRAKVTRNTRPEFVDYSATWWSAHLSLSKPGSKETSAMLSKFLSSQWVLTWIQILAVDHQLQVLVRASKNLLKYLTNLDKSNEVQSPGRQMVEKCLVESWAVDLVKVVGKFGTNLLRNPESIYKQIPPFCPRNSTMYRQFGKTEDKNILVSGLSIQDWDDSVGRLAFGTLATSIATKGALIAVLNSAGSVTAYDAATFEETRASPVKHGERVYRMTLNSNGTLLVTYGFKTTKVWEMSTGTCKITVQNLSSRPRPLAMLLTQDNKRLLAGTDDRCIRCFDLSDPSPTWKSVAELEEQELPGHNLNAASYMALNQDGSLIAVAYRGYPLSAWEVEGPGHIDHCWRSRDDENARGEVIQATWHPHNPELLGLYIEGVVFRWNPYEGRAHELNTGAARLAMSGDGNLFATGDVRGRIRLYTTDRFTLLYQLAAQGTVSAMTFSPDSRRFYDIRGDVGNAWEPDALMRYAEQSTRGAELGDSESDTSSLSQDSATIVNTSQIIQTLTVLSPSPNGSLYCCGTEYGVVQLFSVKRGKLCDVHVSKGSFSIEKLAWSMDGRYICFSDSSKKIFLTSVDSAAGETEPHVETRWSMSMKPHSKGPISQVLFSPDGTELLLQTTSTVCVLSVESGSIDYKHDWHLEECTWIIHPNDRKLLLGFAAGTVSLFDWTLNEIATWYFQLPPTEVPLASGEDIAGVFAVSRVLVTQDRVHILVQMSPIQNTVERVFVYFTLSSLSVFDEAASNTEEPVKQLTPAVLPDNFAGDILLPLSFLSQNRLIFLSRWFALSSLRIPAAQEMSFLAPRPNIPRSNSIADPDSHAIVQFQDPPPLRHSISYDATVPPLEHVSKEIFTLPGDWTSRDSLAICSMWPKEKSFLCPKNGEVAVIRSSALI